MKSHICQNLSVFEIIYYLCNQLIVAGKVICKTQEKFRSYRNGLYCTWIFRNEQWSLFKYMSLNTSCLTENKIIFGKIVTGNENGFIQEPEKKIVARSNAAFAISIQILRIFKGNASLWISGTWEDCYNEQLARLNDTLV